MDELDKQLKAYKNCKDERKKRMLHIRIVENAMQLVKKIACTIALQFEMPNEDLIQVGAIGLMKAIELYNPEKNVKFKTYASHFIRGEIRHYLRDKVSMIKAPREIQELLYKISSAARELKNEGVENPTNEQLAEFIGVDTDKIKEITELELYKNTLSLDQAISGIEDDDLTLIDRIPSGDYQEFLNSYETKIMIASALEQLPPDLREILELSFYEDLNQREIAEKVHFSQMHVSRKLKQAINELYKIIDGEI